MRSALVYLLAAVNLAAPASLATRATETPPTVEASWYGHVHHGRETANGETFNMYALTAAHKDLPFGTVLRVTDAETGRSVVVRINDRGPYLGERAIDLSYGAALKLGMIRRGLAQVRLETLSESPPPFEIEPAD